MRIVRAIGVVVLVAAGATDTLGQETAPPTEPLWKKDRKVLELEVLPLTKEEIVGQPATDGKPGEPGAIDPWIDAVKEKTRELSELRIAAHGGAGDPDAIATVVEQRGALVQRARIVASSLKSKGGDPARYTNYLDAVSGTSIDATSVSSLWAATRNWFVSPEGGIALLMNLAAFLAVLIAFWFASKFAGRIVNRALTAFNRKSSELLRTFAVNCARKTVLVIGFVVALSMLGIEVGPFIAAIGAAGFIIGFALQGTLANFAAGLLILLYRPFDVGHVVTTAGVTGKVETMTLVSTTVLTPDNQRIVIPNGKIWGDVITNVTGSATRRVDLKFGVSYTDDLTRASEVLEELVREHPLTLDDPAPVVRLHELADSSVNFIVRPWAKTSDYWTVYWELTRSVKDRFDAENITIPFPQRDVHLHQPAAAN